MPSFITIEPIALNALSTQTQAVGIRETPPVAFRDNEFRIDQDQWEAWVNRQGRCFRWNSFADLFRAQGHDDDPSSLSVEDLQIRSIEGANRRRVERAFVEREGFPETIILHESRRVLRMPSGAYWREEFQDSRHNFSPIPRSEGRRIEAEAANEVLEDLNSRFMSASLSERLAMKTTFGMGSPRSQGSDRLDSPLSALFGSYRPQEDGERFLQEFLERFRERISHQDRIESPPPPLEPIPHFHRFSGQNYSLGNSNARIAYRPEGETARYFLSQPQNACFAASILNGAIFAGLDVRNDPRLLQGLQKRLVHLQDSWDGRVDVEELIPSIERGEIPGLRAAWVEPEELEPLVNQRRPVIALVPHFHGHAFLITEANAREGYYRTVDTVSGMVVQRNLPRRTFPLCAEGSNDPEETPSEEQYIAIEIEDMERFRAWISN